MEYTFDYLPNTDIYLYQRKDMFRFNTDTHLLGRFMKIKDNEIVLDIGTNNGALLLYATLYNYGKLIGIDIQQDAINLAKKNLEYHKIENYELYVGDIKDIQIPLVDVIVVNPPYFNDFTAKQMNQNEMIKTARHEENLLLSDLCFNISRLLKDEGRVYMVHRANRVVDIVNEFSKNELTIKTMQFIYDENNEEAHGILIEAIKKGGKGCKVEKPYIVKR